MQLLNISLSPAWEECQAIRSMGTCVLHVIFAKAAWTLVGCYIYIRLALSPIETTFVYSDAWENAH